MLEKEAGSMPIDEVFARPLVKTVAFQITFPHLFSIEAKVGEFQSSIMQQFPESTLLLKQSFMLVQSVEGGMQQIPAEPDQAQRIWQFKGPNGVTVELTQGTLIIRSESHKTYAHSS